MQIDHILFNITQLFRIHYNHRTVFTPIFFILLIKLIIHQLNPLQWNKKKPSSPEKSLTLNFIWGLVTSSKTLLSVDYHFNAITSRLTLIHLSLFMVYL